MAKRKRHNPEQIIRKLDDADRRLTSVTYPGGKVVSYTYDANSRRTRLTYPDAGYAAYAYDELGRLTGISFDVNDDQTDSAPQTVATYGYDALSRRVLLSNGNNTSTSYTYDLDDNLSQLVQAYVGGSATFDYGYDDTGLKTSLQVDDSRFEPLIPTGDEENFTPGVLNQYTVAKGESLSYDGNGNLANDGTNTYVYDAENRLISASNTVSSSYTYDSFGRRSLKTVDGTSTTFIYDGDQVIAVKRFKIVFCPNLRLGLVLKSSK